VPGLITVSQAETFTAAPIVMAVSPKLEFNSDSQQVTRDGEKKWTVQAAVSYIPQYGMKAVAEVIEITLVGEQPSISPGTSVEFNKLQVGVSAAEQRERKDGPGTRVVGGKLYWSAAGVRPAGASGNGHPAPAGARAE